jgi:hypothetical protein
VSADELTKTEILFGAEFLAAALGGGHPKDRGQKMSRTIGASKSGINAGELLATAQMEMVADMVTGRSAKL